MSISAPRMPFAPVQHVRPTPRFAAHQGLLVAQEGSIGLNETQLAIQKAYTTLKTYLLGRPPAELAQLSVTQKSGLIRQLKDVVLLSRSQDVELERKPNALNSLADPLFHALKADIIPPPEPSERATALADRPLAEQVQLAEALADLALVYQEKALNRPIDASNSLALPTGLDIDLAIPHLSAEAINEAIAQIQQAPDGLQMLFNELLKQVKPSLYQQANTLQSTDLEARSLITQGLWAFDRCARILDMPLENPADMAGRRLNLFA